MHRIVLADGTHRESKWLRFARSTAYVLCMAGGLLLLASPLLGAAYGSIAEIMAWFLAVGGACAAIGSALKLWWGEFVGLPLLGSAFGVFGVLVWNASHETAPYLAAGNMCILLAFAVFMSARWRILLAIYAVVVNVAARSRKRAPGG
jgi:hypothetical protein